MRFTIDDIYTGQTTHFDGRFAFEQWVQKTANHCFDVHAEPLVQIHLLQDHKQQHFILFVVHHLVADFWTLNLVLKELELTYSKQLTNQPQDLPDINQTYKNYVIEEQQWLAGESSYAARQYWHNRLSSLPTTLELPTDFSRPSEPRFVGREYSFTLPAELTNTVKNSAKKLQVTPFIWLLGCFQLLLHRYTNENRITIGVPMACRNSSDRQVLAGHLTNPIVNMVDFGHDDNFTKLLQTNKEQTFNALKHQEYPLQQLVDELGVQHSVSATALFQVAMSWNQQQSHDHHQQLVQDVLIMEQRGAIFDLVLSGYDRGEDILLSLRYNSDIYKHNTIVRLAEHLTHIVEQTTAAPDTAISSIAYLTEEEQRCIQALNNTETHYPKNRNLGKTFSDVAEKHPKAIAYKYQEQAFTYSDLHEYSNQIANYLTSNGLEPGTHIALCMNRSFDMLAAILACLKCQCIYVPIDPAYPSERMQFMLDSTSAPFILSVKEHSKIINSLDLSDTTAIFLDQRKTEIRKQSAQWDMSGDIENDTIACVLFTSGSTGKPKGVNIPHNAITRLNVNTNYVNIKPGDRFCYLSNVSFDATNIEIWSALLNGGMLLCIDNETLLNPKKFTEFVALEQPTAAMITTALFNLFISYKADLFKGFNYVLVGGEALDINQIRRCIDAGKPRHLYNLYGPTENGTVSTGFEIHELSNDDKTVPIGTPINNSQVYILDQYAQFAGFGIIGEIVVGGDGIATGYLNQPDLTTEKFTPDNFSGNGRLYATGDLGFLRDDGVIIYAGRRDDQVKIRGYRVELGEIEQYLSLHPKIEHCCVIVKNHQGSPYLAAYFTGSANIRHTS